MKLIRFMGFREFLLYILGDTLESHKDWRMAGNRSDSVGFCFFDTSESPEYRLHYLTGNVDISICAEFETVGPIIMKKAMGTYAKPVELKARTTRKIARALEKRKSMKVTEYSIEKYNRHSLKLIRAGIPDIKDFANYTIRWQDAEVWYEMGREDNEQSNVAAESR